jgi:hypothetical protein
VRYGDDSYMRQGSEHTAEHWTQRALDEQRDNRDDNHADDDGHGEADVA